jgi:CRP-like cAMP-binding protein
MANGAAAPANYWYLKSTGISETVGQVALRRLACGMETRTLERGEMAFPAEKGACFLFVGCVGVSRIDPTTGKEVILYIVKPGEFFGVNLKDGDARRSVARALQNSRVGYLDRNDLRDLMMDDAFRTEMHRVLESRLAQLETRVEELVFKKVESRLARLLLRLSRDFPAACPESHGSLISVALTQNDIACLIGASREITNLTLNEFRRSGWVAFHSRRICVHDAPLLKELSLAV